MLIQDLQGTYDVGDTLCDAILPTGKTLPFKVIVLYFNPYLPLCLFLFKMKKKNPVILHASLV